MYSLPATYRLTRGIDVMHDRRVIYVRVLHATIRYHFPCDNVARLWHKPPMWKSAACGGAKPPKQIRRYSFSPCANAIDEREQRESRHGSAG
jgi:hypothetical protein